MAQLQEFPLTPLDSRATSLNADSEGGVLNSSTGPSAGTRVVEALDSYPDGGFDAWLQVFCCSMIFMVCVGGVYSWGVMQDALAGVAATSTIAYIGSCQAAMTGFLAIPVNRALRTWGPRPVAIFGSLCCSLGPFIGSWCTHSLPALFLTEGLLFGVGQSSLFFAAGTLPSSYFLRKRNLATGAVYAGGGIGGAVFSLGSGALLSKLGVPLTLRILGCMFFAMTMPSALMLKGRAPKQPFRGGTVIDISMFKDKSFLLILVGTAIGMFPLFVAPFFLPLYSTSLGLSSFTGSLLLAGYNLASAVGRLGFGLGADRLLGPVGSLIVCLTFVGLTTLVIWPVATSLAPLAIFTIVNGICAGGFFSLLPGVVSSLFGSSKLSVTLGMLATTWAPGYFLGSPIAGFILGAAGGADSGIEAFRPAIFYAGAVSLFAAGIIIAARLIVTKDLRKKI
ncbi:major facilitator superfamily domain-containing protein [Leucosporidium creatinivorum]|uniref:Major facilitator superfamily domain-containing protein n=1 Tax=Leucosporidium creatinivorum TaxID=106004 RepID=A0A1Y2DZR6_9BASI|nr:major facilitator superfamily domain-containing protein [Leucosporidium creatinivorum]